MKIIKQQLKQLIQKELDDLNENMFSDREELDASHDVEISRHFEDEGSDVESGYAVPLKQIQEDIAEILNILKAGGGSY